jgi:subtilisin family serine protease
MSRSCRLVPAALLSFVCSVSSAARADEALTGPRLVRLLGDRAQHVFAPHADVLGALVTLPPGVEAKTLGLEPFVPGYARLHARPADVVAYAEAHPDLHIELAPPLHTSLDKAGQFIRSVEAHESLGLEGTGVLVGVADTGLDVTLADFKDPKTGKSRVAWILDLSLPPAGIYPEIEKRFCIKDGAGKCAQGAVLQGKDIDALNPATAGGKIPIDESGHGTHVTSIAAGNGGPASVYVGGAPKSQIIFARVTRDSSESISTDDILTGVSFIFDRADAMKLPVAANLSIGTDFGPHDGSMSWEKALATFVGESSPGRALVVAAGNSGSIAYTAATAPIHQTVHVVPDSSLSIPIPTAGAISGDAEVEIWVSFTAGSSLSVGLDGPDGTWIAPVAAGQTGSDSTGTYTASIVNGSSARGSEVPKGSNGAVIVWTGAWPAGTYAVTLEGQGTADLWVQSSGTTAPNESTLGFESGVREGTIELPATQPALIGVGCTVNRAKWTSIDGQVLSFPGSPRLDDAGGVPIDGSAPFIVGEVCWFSSAGPTVTGVPKPEISAPGAFVVGAMSTQAPPGAAYSIFTDGACPTPPDGGFADPRCLQVDSGHAVAEGTSMSAPMVTGGVALLFEKDPTLTQSELVPILQGGAHYFRHDPLTPYVPFQDQGGPGELDVVGSLQVLDQMSDPAIALPRPCDGTTPCESWLTLSTDYMLADGSTPTVAILELRSAAGGAADLFEPSRLSPDVAVDGVPLPTKPALVRRGPGVWVYSVTPSPGFAGESITFGATFDGAPIVAPHTLPIATDPWSAAYPSQATDSGCTVAVGRPRGAANGSGWAAFGCLGVALLGRRRRVREVRPRR